VKKSFAVRSVSDEGGFNSESTREQDGKHTGTRREHVFSLQLHLAIIRPESVAREEGKHFLTQTTFFRRAFAG